MNDDDEQDVGMGVDELGIEVKHSHYRYQKKTLCIVFARGMMLAI